MVIVSGVVVAGTNCARDAAASRRDDVGMMMLVIDDVKVYVGRMWCV